MCELIAFFSSEKGREDFYRLFAQSDNKKDAQFGKVFVDDMSKALWGGTQFHIFFFGSM